MKRHLKLISRLHIDKGRVLEQFTRCAILMIVQSKNSNCLHRFNSSHSVSGDNFQPDISADNGMFRINVFPNLEAILKTNK